MPDVLRVANTSVAHTQRAHPGEIDKAVREWFAQHGIPLNITESEEKLGRFLEGEEMNTGDHAAEEAKVRQAILDYYSEGHVKSDPLLYEEILHPEWRFFLFDEHGQLRIVDRDEYVSRYDPDEVDPALVWETEFYSVDVTENIAAVKLRLECQDVRYIDYFHMMRISGRWWIVHKMSVGLDKRVDQG